MCVIVYKPKGIEMPSAEIINACACANRDGFGFCTPTKFFKSTSFYEFSKRLAAVGKDEPCIMHFRLATHGCVCKSNCHPFKREDICFAHNGVLSIVPFRGKTDSETAFSLYIVPAIKHYGLDAEETKAAIEAVRESSRFAVMQGEQVRLFGDFYEVDGCSFSNLRFVSYMNYDRHLPMY